MNQFQITFRGMPPSENLRAMCEERFQKMIKLYGQGSRCHVVIERPSADGPNGPFSARVQLQAGTQLHASAHSEHASAGAAVRKAFQRAHAQVETRGARVGQTARLLGRNHLLLLR